MAAINSTSFSIFEFSHEWMSAEATRSCYHLRFLLAILICFYLLKETASSYEETIEIYRNHLLLASHSGLDPQLVEALQHITELRKSAQ